MQAENVNQCMTFFWCNEYVEGLKHKFLSASFSNNTKNPITFTHQHRPLSLCLCVSLIYFSELLYQHMFHHYDGRTAHLISHGHRL